MPGIHCHASWLASAAAMASPSASDQLTKAQVLAVGCPSASLSRPTSKPTFFWCWPCCSRFETAKHVQIAEECLQLHKSTRLLYLLKAIAQQ